MKIKIQLVIALAAVFILGAFAGALFSKDQKNRKHIVDPVYAIVEGQKIKASDVFPHIESDLRQLEKNQYDLKRRATEEFIQKKFSAQFPAASPKSVAITEAELESFLKSRGLERKKLSSSQIKDIEGNLQLQKRKEIEKKSQSQVQIQWKIPLPPENQVQVGKGSLSAIGTQKAPVEIFLVSNFHCSTCQEAGKRLQELQDKYPNQLTVQYRFDFQEPDDSIVRAAAEAAYCANDEGKFWAFHDEMLKSGPVKSTEDLKKISQQLGLDPERFNTCLSARKYQVKLNEELIEIQKLGSVRAPSLVINGRLRSASLPIEELSIVIDQELP